MSRGINVFRNKRRRKKSRGNIRHLGINVAQSLKTIFIFRTWTPNVIPYNINMETSKHLPDQLQIQ